MDRKRVVFTTFANEVQRGEAGVHVKIADFQVRDLGATRPDLEADRQNRSVTTTLERVSWGTAIFVVVICPLSASAGFLLNDLQRDLKRATESQVLRKIIGPVDAAVAAKKTAQKAVKSGESSEQIRADTEKATDASATAIAVVSQADQLPTIAHTILRQLGATRDEFRERVRQAACVDRALRVAVFVGAALSALLLAIAGASKRTHTCVIILTSLVAAGQTADATFKISSDYATLKRCAKGLDYAYQDCQWGIQMDVPLAPVRERNTKLAEVLQVCRANERRYIEEATKGDVAPITAPKSMNGQ